MSQAEELLNSLTPYAANDPEERFVVGSDRFITVPTSMKRIGVQGDHNVKTIPFDCPRYCDDGYDMSEMVVYIVYVLADGTPGAYIAKNVSADGDIMHFDWTIRSEVTRCGGFVKFFVCVKHTDGEGNLENHWHSEMCEEVYVSEGPEDVEPVNKTYPDIVTQLLERMMDVEAVRDLTDAAADMAIESANTATEAAAKAEEHEANAQRIADGTVDILADLSKAHKRITNVKASISITPPEEHDTSVAAVKVVPENALPYAEVVSVGGSTTKIKHIGVNLLDPSLVNGSFASYESDTDTLTVTSADSRAWSEVTLSDYIVTAGQYIVRKDTGYNLQLRFCDTTTGETLSTLDMSAIGTAQIITLSSACRVRMKIATTGVIYPFVVPWVMMTKNGLPGTYVRFCSTEIVIPDSVRQLDGYGEEGSYVDLRNRLFVKADGTRIDISNLLSSDNMIGVEPDGPITIVTETGEAVPSEISWSSC